MEQKFVRPAILKGMAIHAGRSRVRAIIKEIVFLKRFNIPLTQRDSMPELVSGLDQAIR
jgi:hypothetical protein